MAKRKTPTTSPSKSVVPTDLISKPPGATTVIPDAEPIAVPIAETPVRKTVTPKAAAPKAPAITYERVAERAYYISRSGNGGSEYDNWLRAENELKGEV